VKNQLTLADLDDRGKDNNFNLIRLAAALTVIVSHSFPLAGATAAEPLAILTGDMTLGSMAVDVFFVTSGFLVTKSLLVRQSLLQFVAARCLRIYPGLIVMTLLTIVVAGMFAPPGFYSDHRTLRYALSTGLLWLPTLRVFDLPGIFTSNPFPNAVNGSLWTLPFELRMYTILAALGLAAGLLKASRVRLVQIAVVALAICGAAAEIARPQNPMAGFIFMFFTGGSYYVLRRRIPLHRGVAWSCALLILATLANRSAFVLTYHALMAYVLFAAAYLPTLPRPKQDYSYGTYIYAFPIQQCIAQWHPGISWVLMVLAAIPLVLVAAALSWHLVEKPALAMKDYVVRRRGAARAGGPARQDEGDI
jgi:peptidoglycan/LPS O-acetylase OafA/YrhL